MKKIMILGASILQVPAYLEAKKLGIYTIAVDMDPQAEAFQYADYIEVISTIDKNKVLAAAKKHNIDGIITLASDMPMQTVAYVCQHMGLLGIDQYTALNATNKEYMRKALLQHAIPIPEFHICKNQQKFFQITELMSKPFIVKPADSSGSRGIQLIREKSENDELIKIYQYSNNYSPSNTILVEEFIDGSEVSVESISENGKCHIIQITDKLTTGAPYFVEMGHSQPSILHPEIIEKIKVITKNAVAAIGIKNGPAHTEIKITKSGEPKIIELGARLGGDCITTHLVPLSTGVNMVKNVINQAINEPIDMDIQFNKASAIRYIQCDTGMLKKIVGLDEAKNIEGVIEIAIAKKLGDEISVLRNSKDRFGFVIAQSDSAENAIKNCKKAINHLKIKVEKK